jgi:aryl-phospho-beta-D-glucosidase BglC (GH1 family)
LAVIIDMHPDSDFKQRLVQHDEFVEQFSDFWRAIARHYATYDPEMVYFEVLNEPEFRDRYRWAGVQAKLANAIREGAPKHTIIAAGANWSDIPDLVALTPLADANVIYNFHYYEPHTFTHQGATWGVNFWHFESKLAYPSNMENVEKVASEQPDAVNRYAVLEYGLDHWDANRIAAEIGQAADWAKHWNVPLTCNEFGVYRKDSDPQDRGRWLHDVRTTLERDGIGWNMWDFGGRDNGRGFGVVNGGRDGSNVPDELTLQALGLKR